jgi:hypothetical protein
MRMIIVSDGCLNYFGAFKFATSGTSGTNTDTSKWAVYCLPLSKLLGIGPTSIMKRLLLSSRLFNKTLSALHFIRTASSMRMDRDLFQV